MTYAGTPPEVHPSLAELDAAEAQAAAAFALGRRLAAETDLAWQLYEIEFCLGGPEYGPGLRLWTAPGDAEGVRRWADLLNVTVQNSQSALSPLDIHHFAEGQIEGVPVRVWSIVSTPITGVAIGESTDIGWHVSYDQGGQRTTYPLPDEAAARAWAARYARVAP
jgi:hypothetical protein